jgi:four helix bundle protein
VKPILKSETKISSFEDLVVWQKSIDLSAEIYQITRIFPKEEVFGLTAQLRRACNSISLNISEGSVKSTKTFIYHLYNALGSATEVLSASILANRLKFIDDKNLQVVRDRIIELTKMLNALIKALEKKSAVLRSASLVT